jgi:hypothetical protein
MVHAGLCVEDIPALRRDPRSTSASSRCTSSRARCSTSSTCRWASSPRSTAACATWARSPAWPATPAPRRWTAAATPPPPRPNWCCTSSAGRGRARPGGHGGHAGGAQRLDQRRARPLQVQPGHARHHRRRCAMPAPPTCWQALERICERRGLHFELEETMRAAAAPSAPAWQARWERAVAAHWACRAPHAQRRRARRDEAARGDAAGHAVHARGERRHQPQPAGVGQQPRHRLCVQALQNLLDAACHGARPMSATATPPSTPGSTPLRREVRFLQELVRVPTDTPPGNNAPHAERTAACCRPSASTPSATPCPTRPCRPPACSPSPTWSCGAATATAARHRAERPRRRGAARRGLDARPLRRRGRGRPALRPRRGGQQERLRHLHLRDCARSKPPAQHKAALKGGVELHFTYDEEFGGELGPAGCWATA